MSTSDERHGNRPKAARPFGLRRKSASGSSKHSTVFPDTLFALLLPQDDFRSQRGSRGLYKRDLLIFSPDERITAHEKRIARLLWLGCPRCRRTFGRCYHGN